MRAGTCDEFFLRWKIYASSLVWRYSDLKGRNDCRMSDSTQGEAAEFGFLSIRVPSRERGVGGLGYLKKCEVFTFLCFFGVTDRVGRQLDRSGSPEWSTRFCFWCSGLHDDGINTKLPARPSDGTRTHFAFAHDALLRDCDSVSLHDDTRENSCIYILDAITGDHNK